MAEKPSADLKKRIEHIVEEFAVVSPEGLRQTRALEVLEHLRTPQALALLHRIADGAPNASLTRQAKDSLARLAVHISSRR
jgi:hypothetical protein